MSVRWKEHHVGSQKTSAREWVCRFTHRYLVKPWGQSSAVATLWWSSVFKHRGNENPSAPAQVLEVLSEKHGAGWWCCCTLSSIASLSTCAIGSSIVPGDGHSVPLGCFPGCDSGSDTLDLTQYCFDVDDNVYSKTKMWSTSIIPSAFWGPFALEKQSKHIESIGPRMWSSSSKVAIKDMTLT